MASNMEYPVHSDILEKRVIQALLASLSDSKGQSTSNVNATIANLLLGKSDVGQQASSAPVLQQRGNTAIKRSEMVDFEGV